MQDPKEQVTKFFNGMAKELHADQVRLLNYQPGGVRPIAPTEAYEKLALMSTEVSELIKAYHKDLPSDHIPGFTGEEEECADVILRALDYAGARNLRIGEALVAKIEANSNRGTGYGKVEQTRPRKPRAAPAA